jgi:hypothetical protein
VAGGPAEIDSGIGSQYGNKESGNCGQSPTLTDGSTLHSAAPVLPGESTLKIADSVIRTSFDHIGGCVSA